MPDDKPSSAPDDGLLKADDLRAAAILHDDEKTPGDGGLLGAGAADAAAERSTGGTARNAPIDVSTPDGSAGAAEAESIADAGEDAPEPRPTSQ